MSTGRREFCQQFFAELARSGIDYAILDRSSVLPGPPGSDVDYVVSEPDLHRVGPLLHQFSGSRGWVVAQSVRHAVYSIYSVVVDPADPRGSFALDAHAHLSIGARVLASDRNLLAGRRAGLDGYVRASPAAEFAYVLARAVDEPTQLDRRLQRLRSLVLLDRLGAEAGFVAMFGDTGRSLDDWLTEPAPSWVGLRRSLEIRHPVRTTMALREAGRLAGRVLRPSGLYLAVLGPDGAGKTTLIENLRHIVGPWFGDWKVVKFRPGLSGQIVLGDEAPHDRPPRSRVVSWAKVLYYFGDTWLGWLLVVRPSLVRNACVTFDRDFDDLIIDQRRYLIQGSGLLARVLRRLAPQANATVVLDADADVVRARKPELSPSEIEEQRAAYRRLSASNPRYRLIAADQSPEAVAGDASRAIIDVLGRRRYPQSQLKRLFDVTASIAALALLWPVLLAVALLVRTSLGSPILFKQQRPGLGGRRFTMYKFRTMKDLTYSNGRRRPDAERTTRFGNLLRSTSLDELPELVNVLRGEMSLVGPRPLLLEYLPRYSPEQMRRHEVLPGITGWAQINGRGVTAWSERFALDVWYVDHRSMLLDLRIVLVTIGKVLRREGVTAPGSGSLGRFYGSEVPTEEARR